MLPDKILIHGDPAPNILRDHWDELLCNYEESRLAPPNLRTEIDRGVAGEGQKLWAFLWEAMLFRHFAELGFKFRNHQTTSGQDGPDLGVIHNNSTIWIEAVVPSPSRKGFPDDWLAPIQGGFRVYSVPHEQMLLRWTSVLHDKLAQLSKRQGRSAAGCHGAYIVAVNSCMLSAHDSEDLGISQLPFAVEAVFPVGPLAIPMTEEGRPAAPPTHTRRLSIKNQNGADVPTNNFFDPNYAGISALIGCSRNHMIEGELHLIAVHNPLARTPVPTGILGADVEYVAEEDEERQGCYLLRRIDGKAAGGGS